jgi:hypothetical protein
MQVTGLKDHSWPCNTVLCRPLLFTFMSLYYDHHAASTNIILAKIPASFKLKKWD